MLFASRLSKTFSVLVPFTFLAFAVTAHADFENPPIPGNCNVGSDENTLAATCLFASNNAGLPTSAETDFRDNWDDTQYDALTLATHELFHAIGFTVNYDNFASHVYGTPGAGANGIPAGSRVYSTNGTVGGILMTLTPSGDGTHADPSATGAGNWPATGYNQANDIMQPELPINTVRTLSATDFAVLNNAFGWGTTGLNIQIVNLGGTMDQADLDILANAASAVVTGFGGSKTNSPTFVWDVAEVPEPSFFSLSAAMSGVLLLFFVKARRRPTN